MSEDREVKMCKKFYARKDSLDNLIAYIKDLDSDYKKSKKELKQGLRYNKYTQILDHLFRTDKLANVKEHDLIKFLTKK